jgi:ATP-binding cassette subfamily C (CFTR/MRP) protein 3
VNSTSILIVCEIISSRLVLHFFNDPTKPIWLGIFYAILLSISMFCQVIILQAYFQCQYVVGLRFRSAITGLVHRKVYNLFYIHHQLSVFSFSLQSLKLSNSSNQETTTGEIVNLVRSYSL